MTTPTKGPYARKRWAVSEITEGVPLDGTQSLTVRIRRKRKTSEEGKEKKRKMMESLALVEEEEQSQKKKKREERKFLALAKEARDLDAGPPPITKKVRAVVVTGLGALAWDAIEQQDFGTRRLTAMINPEVLREDDRQKSHAPLSGRGGRACVKTAHEKSMFAPGTWQ
jgi:hypothetical protein